MKIIKLNSKDYTNLESLLKRADLVNENEKTASPERLYVNEKTYRTMKARLSAALKVEHPGLNKRAVDYSVGAYLLNLGPAVLRNKNGGNHLPDGYAIVISND